MMSKHPLTLEETKLWQIYRKKLTPIDPQRVDWVRGVYDAAVSDLKYVVTTFPNYTLHDETHILNVLFAMAGLLGDWIDILTVTELELLILVAALHDIGMVYTDEAKAHALSDRRKCDRFILDHKPDLYGLDSQEWDERTQQWYLRDCHPFRVRERLYEAAWREIFNRRPRDIVPENIIIAVCSAHGESVSEIRENEILNDDKARDIDPRFCAMLLRLADLLDFDDTRTPSVLFQFAANDEKSVQEWKKHMSSVGFVYPEVPSQDDLRYIAECHAPGEEHAIREFLNWIDAELDNCRDLQRLCRKDWQHDFKFPLKVSRESITRVGYVSDEFKITMDQNRILELLTGENLYEDNTVFVRELLQNAVDATLLRGKMDPFFNVEEAGIYLWEWTDTDGNLYFRIDDQGTGMTLNMLKNYFLKVGNSYYTSQEIIQDLQRHRCRDGYYAISRFGIGFISCFLCGDSAEVSTLYFEESKCNRESNETGGDHYGYGLRLSVTGLEGYYVLKNQAANHIQDTPLPAPANFDTDLAFNGYRAKAGTSIVIRINPEKMRVHSLINAAKKAVCGTRMPVYYNGERIGRTYKEIQNEVYKLAGKTLYFELTSEDKREFDRCFPLFTGNYPQIAATVTPIDKDRFFDLKSFWGFLIQYQYIFGASTNWTVKGVKFALEHQFHFDGDKNTLIIGAYPLYKGKTCRPDEWADYYNEIGINETNKLETHFSKLSQCPISSDVIGEAWIPFKEKDLDTVWMDYVSHSQYAKLTIPFDSLIGIPSINSLTGHACLKTAYAYQGIFIEGYMDNIDSDKAISAVFFLENDLQPKYSVNRQKATYPLIVCEAVTGILNCSKLQYRSRDLPNYDEYWDISCTSKMWRELCDSSVGKWVLNTFQNEIKEFIQFLREPFIKNHVSERINDRFNSQHFFADGGVLSLFFISYLQDSYSFKIDYISGQTISLENKEHCVDSKYDQFPPMMFCQAIDNENKKFLCCGNAHYRKGITQDHPFITWLINNATLLNKKCKYLYRYTILSLRNYDMNDIIMVVNELRNQIIMMRKTGINIPLFEPLTENDFWMPDELKYVKRE